MYKNHLFVPQGLDLVKANEVGVNVGPADTNREGLPIAVSLSGDEMGRFFLKHGLMVL